MGLRGKNPKGTGEESAGAKGARRRLDRAWAGAAARVRTGPEGGSVEERASKLLGSMGIPVDEATLGFARMVKQIHDIVDGVYEKETGKKGKKGANARALAAVGKAADVALRLHDRMERLGEKRKRSGPIVTATAVAVPVSKAKTNGRSGSANGVTISVDEWGMEVPK